MTDTDNLVLARLRDISGVLDTVLTTLDEVVTRIGHLERSVAQQAMQFADMNVRLDGMEKRLGRSVRAHRLGMVIGYWLTKARQGR